jgi:transcriptional regulator with XRE-family HTH domain
MDMGKVLRNFGWHLRLVLGNAADRDELARRVGVHPTTIERWLRSGRETRLTIGQLVRLVTAAGASPEVIGRSWLRALEDERFGRWKESEDG